MSRTRSNIPFLQRIQGESLSDLQRRSNRDRQWERYYFDEILRRARDEDMYATIVEAISSDNPMVLDDLLDAYRDISRPVDIQSIMRFAFQTKRYNILDSLVQRVEPRIVIAAYVDNMNQQISQPTLGILMLSSNPFFYEIGTYLAELLYNPESRPLAGQLVDIIFRGLGYEETIQLLEELSSLDILTYSILDRVGPSLFGELGPSSWGLVRELLSDSNSKKALEDILKLNIKELDSNYLPNISKIAPSTHVTRTFKLLSGQEDRYPNFSPIRSPRSLSPELTRRSPTDRTIKVPTQSTANQQINSPETFEP